MDENRRGFLKRASSAALGLGCGLPLVGAGCGSSSHGSGSGQPSQWAMVIDVEKCLNSEVRDACRKACHGAHNVPDVPESDDEVKWIWTEQYEHVFSDQAHAHINDTLKEAPVLVLCNHCSRPPCVKVCPTQATWKRKSDGLVMMDMHRCIGCRYCIAACPYGARSFNWKDPRKRDAQSNALLYFENNELPSSTYPARSKGVVEKCTFCAERIRSGDDPVPACVEAANSVPGGEGALTFGNLSETDSEVRRILREKHTIARRVSLGTGPNVFYIV